MAYDLMAPLFNILSPKLFLESGIIGIIAFIVWELPRSIKVMSEEYTHGLYPEAGRVVDFILLFLLIISTIYLNIGQTSEHLSLKMRSPSLFPIIAVILLTTIVIIILGYLKRTGERTGKHDSLTVFFVQSILDLAHTIFFITLSINIIPLALYLVLA